MGVCAEQVGGMLDLGLGCWACGSVELGMVVSGVDDFLQASGIVCASMHVLEACR